MPVPGPQRRESALSDDPEENDDREEGHAEREDDDARHARVCELARHRELRVRVPPAHPSDEHETDPDKEEQGGHALTLRPRTTEQITQGKDVLRLELELDVEELALDDACACDSIQRVQ